MVSALPIGNGSLGGMIFGSLEKEQIQFNEKTLWTGGPESRGAYQNFGHVFIEFPEKGPVSDYRRDLSLDTAIASVSYKAGGVLYLREYFASFPDKVIVMRLSTPGNKGLLNITVTLDDAHNENNGKEKIIAPNQIRISGKFDLLNYDARLAVLNEGGSIKAGHGLVVSKADAVIILLTGATNYGIHSDSYIGETAAELEQRLGRIIDRASLKSFRALRQNHLIDYQRLFNRVTLDLDAEMPPVPTDELIQSQSESSYLDLLYFQYGRYLLISSSRGIDLPNNLQGIWNNNNDPPWQCDIHTNINIQMNYWPAETANLSECHLPFLNYIAIEAMRKNGAWQKAAASLGNPGWALKTQTNIFGYTDWNWNRPANAWYCMHLWQHYAYTDDKLFLKEKAFPVMKSACEFWMDRLVLNEDANWEAPDEWSPEHGSWEDGVSYAQQLIWELFDKTLKAASIAGADHDFISGLQKIFDKLDSGVSIGPWGNIREWKKDIDGLDNSENKHRHLSHLIALYPGDRISFLGDGKFTEAARVSLNARGGGGTGWSRAWKIACWARLLDGDRAHGLLKAAMKKTDITVVIKENHNGGIYENLLDAHPPFQIDGNFGAAAGIAEMLIQSHAGFIHLLPALPSAWPRGSFRGLRARGNFTVNLSWENSLPLECSVYSGSGNECTLCYKNKTVTFSTEADKEYSVNWETA